MLLASKDHPLGHSLLNLAYSNTTVHIDLLFSFGVARLRAKRQNPLFADICFGE